MRKIIFNPCYDVANRLDQEDAKYYGSLGISNLAGLDLNDQNLEIYLDSIAKHPITSLNLANNIITNEGAAILANFIRSHKATEVSGKAFRTNQYLYKVGHYVEIRNEPKMLRVLKEIDLSHNLITDKGAQKLLDAIKESPNIISLKLSNNFVINELLGEIKEACYDNMRKTGELFCPKPNSNQNTAAMILATPNNSFAATESLNLANKKTQCTLM